jgi:hypothetical protein
VAPPARFFLSLAAYLSWSRSLHSRLQKYSRMSESGRVCDFDGESVHPVNTPFDEPLSFQICELFKVRYGKLLRIEALVAPVPYGMPTGWGGKPSHKE